ncbi:polyamine-transporting ATPase 13A3-like isoform X2 [Lycorma delicatula]|uniref:polyamine-transporting ATPase 13A3-like isoform X2 n=1 Tax=Lycorma delicatula TaxID=130591 RepID=UPI003F50E8B6
MGGRYVEVGGLDTIAYVVHAYLTSVHLNVLSVQYSILLALSVSLNDSDCCCSSAGRFSIKLACRKISSKLLYYVLGKPYRILWQFKRQINWIRISSKPCENKVPTKSTDDSKKKSNCNWSHEECNFINLGEEDEMEVFGYQKSVLSTTLMWVGIILTLGLFRLLLHWRPDWKLYLSHKRCPLKYADKVLVVDTYEKRFKSLFIRDVKWISPQKESEKSNEITGYNKTSEKTEEKKLKIHLNNGSSAEVTDVRAVWIKKMCYIWDEEKRSFIKLVGLDRGQTRSELHSYKGYSKEEQEIRRVMYGRNEILIKVQSIGTLIILEALNPFYIFQVFTICVWLAEAYYYYCFAIVFMSLFGISSAVLQTRQNQKNLHRTVHSSGTVTICRGEGIYEEISTADLVPGDVIVIPAQGCIMHCDAALLVGTCIVNESMLTGESVPVMKTALQNENSMYKESDDSNHTLFCGTHVLQTRYYGSGKVHAVVLRTGFLTAKGSLVRSILYPPPADFQFDHQTYKFIWILAGISLLGLIYTVVTKSSRGLQPVDIIIKALDIITIVIPPSLPAAMTVGKLYALRRLQNYKISCINSRVINVSGSVNCVCFDKTGTLTEDGLDMWGVVPVNGKSFTYSLNDISQLDEGGLLYGMASCHSLTVIDNVISGDPLDVKMFESTGWLFEEHDIPNETKYNMRVSATVRPSKNNPEMEIAIVHQFQFLSSLQRMSVVTKTLGSDNFVVYCKGSPEMIQSLSDPCTVPENMTSILQDYTEQGYRVIALGFRELNSLKYSDLQKMNRNEIERDLKFCGLIVLENRLKPQTIGVIDVLKFAKIKIVMVTGDNILTAVSVAKECGIIGHEERVVEVNAEMGYMKSKPTISYITGKVSYGVLEPNGENFITSDCEAGNSIISLNSYRFAITGNSWAIIREHCPELIPKLCVRGAVFARMSSEQKQQLIQDLQQLGYCVAMCGDGANDCGALKAAHTGISLSEAESSVASPFTSQIANISCVPLVIKECRAALVTSFGVFKFMILYSITEFLSTIILYSIDSNLTPNEFLFIDLCLGLNFAFSFGRNHAYKGPLVPQVPLTSIFSVIALSSMIFQVIIVFIFQCLSYYLIHLFPWFKPFHYILPTYYTCYENYAVFSISQFQYITIAFIYSQGKPYREPMYTNRVFFLSILCMTTICTYITLYPADWIISFLELQIPEKFDFPLLVLCLAGVYFIVSVFFESFVVQYLMFKKFRHLINDPKKSRNQYLTIEHDLVQNKMWPPLSENPSDINNDQSVDIVDETTQKIITSDPSAEHAVVEGGHDNLGFSPDDTSVNTTTKF